MYKEYRSDDKYIFSYERELHIMKMSDSNYIMKCLSEDETGIIMPIGVPYSKIYDKVSIKDTLCLNGIKIST